MGMRMTTHLFRHAIATLLVNICEADLQEVATLLGNTVEVTARHYVFNDGLRQRMRAVHRLAEARSNLAGPQKAQGKSS
jgi:site-specific recombinase XerD